MIKIISTFLLICIQKITCDICSYNYYDYSLNLQTYYFSCPRTQVCCNRYCCDIVNNVGAAFYNLWYFWAGLIFIIILCSVGIAGCFYKRKRRRMFVHPLQRPPGASVIVTQSQGQMPGDPGIAMVYNPSYNVRQPPSYYSASQPLPGYTERGDYKQADHPSINHPQMNHPPINRPPINYSPINPINHIQSTGYYSFTQPMQPAYVQLPNVASTYN